MHIQWFDLLVFMRNLQNKKIDRSNQVLRLYEEFKQKYKKPKEQWRLWCKRQKSLNEKEEIIIGSILTQQTNWKNVELAIGNLKRAGLNSIGAIYRLGKTNKTKLARLIKPSGFYHQKSEYLFEVSKFVIEKHGGIKKLTKTTSAKLRSELLDLKGIGQESADSILLYALNKPVFVVDRYTKDFVKKNLAVNDFSYNCLQRLFENNLPRNYKLYQDYHAFIIIHEQEIRKEDRSTGRNG